MVYIHKVTVKDFKSFNGVVKLSFKPGFNVITGPNGSGKSNIIDAIQFVFGELGSKRMRVPDLSGLIFDGANENSSGRPRYAQVTIHFNNVDRGLAIDRKIVSVGRRVDLQGKSKYFLNGKISSRRRILDLLEMTGITPGGYNIVLQGTATRLSDLTPSERMTALENLIGITEYDEKKSEAKIRLSEAERKIEVATARIDEVRKLVNELERQRNDAIRYNLLTNEEQKLLAFQLSHQITQLESKMNSLNNQILENENQVKKIEEETEKIEKEKEAAIETLEVFNKDASEKGNTRLPLLNSELVGKITFKNSLESRLKQIEFRKLAIQKNIDEKLSEIEQSKSEMDKMKVELQNLVQSEAQKKSEITEKETQLSDVMNKISAFKETAESNQKRIEDLTESLIPMQESLSGLEIEINRHLLNLNSLKSKLGDLELKKNETSSTIKTFEKTIEELESLKVNQFIKIEEMLETIEEQIKRQKNIRGTIEGAGKLAKNAETSITEFSAKRDLWKKIESGEKARARIAEMGKAGALKGYYGLLRSLLKIDLKYQRAVRTSSNGWINSIVVEDEETAIQCIESLKKNKLGMTKFIPLNNLKFEKTIPEIEEEGVLGPIPQLIRYEEKFAPAVKLVWGDTYVAKDRKTATKLSKIGYRVVALSGDVFEPKGGLIGGHYRRPPDFTKLIPSEESVKTLSSTIKMLRQRLGRRMSDLKKSGGNLRKFTSQIDELNQNVEVIEERNKDTQDNISRLERKIATIEEGIQKIEVDEKKELNLVSTLEERKKRTLEEIERTKQEINDLKEISPSNVASLEVIHDNIVQELSELKDQRAQIISDISIQTNFIEGYLKLKTLDSENQIKDWREEINNLDVDHSEIISDIEEISEEIKERKKTLDIITSEVESTSKILERHRRTVRQYQNQIERLVRRQTNIERKLMELKVEVEKHRLQIQQKYDELSNLGFNNIIPVDNIDLNSVFYTLQNIRKEKASLGAINQLAIKRYEEVVIDYKLHSVRINELEKEKNSILNFIDQIEREKQEHFMKAFNEVCENFSQIFAKLTGGGDGRLELQKPENPFAGGVDLYVQFPGKPMRLASGASGGERSVAAITYLLAIQKFLKAPFYLFDEIDAHLDDVNTARLADVLKENALESQFFMVSLKDVMVHNADRIYGVFAQDGRSRVIALPMKLEVTI